jgi:hypothetical protein
MTCTVPKFEFVILSFICHLLDPGIDSDGSGMVRDYAVNIAEKETTLAN